MAENAMSETEREQCYRDSTAIATELHGKGKLLSANPLHPVSTATSVRVREGKRFVTDGPYAETREQLGGYYLLDVQDKSEAIDIASRLPPSHKGSVEVRGVPEVPGLPRAGGTNPKKDGSKFMLISYDDEQAWKDAGPNAHTDALAEAIKLTHQMDTKGQYLLASPLESAASGSVVRNRDGKRIVTDGPYAETREVLGGFYLIKADNLDEAIALAAQHPGAKRGTTEVRPVLEIPNKPGV
jgi:hypothetical protein